MGKKVSLEIQKSTIAKVNGITVFRVRGSTYLSVTIGKNMLEKTLESPLDCKEIQPVHSKGGQSWVFIGRTDTKAETPILWPPHLKRS